MVKYKKDRKSVLTFIGFHVILYVSLGLGIFLVVKIRALEIGNFIF